jgi:hypothetical protein
MPSLVDMLRRLADEYEKEEHGEVSKATEQRIAELEAAVKRAPADDREEALEELDEDEWELVKQHRASKETPESKPKRERKPAEEEKPRRTRPGRKAGAAYNWYLDDDNVVQRSDIPVVYNGDDEPDEVELPDEPEAEVA